MEEPAPRKCVEDEELFSGTLWTYWTRKGQEVLVTHYMKEFP